MQNWHPWFLTENKANPTSRLKPGGGVQAALSITLLPACLRLSAHREKLSNRDVLGLLDDTVDDAASSA